MISYYCDLQKSYNLPDYDEIGVFCISDRKKSPFINMAKVHKSVGFGTRSADARDNPFLPNNEAGLLLSHQPRCQAEQHGIGESVNLDSMAIEKV